MRKFGGEGKSLANMAKCQQFTKLKPAKLVVIIITLWSFAKLFFAKGSIRYPSLKLGLNWTEFFLDVPKEIERSVYACLLQQPLSAMHIANNTVWARL